jgi:hypothetical protein
MQTIDIDGTTYKVKFDRDLLELAKLARKPYRPKKPKDIRRFPFWTESVSPAQYVRQFEKLNFLIAGEYFPRLNVETAAQYDPTIPLCEVFNDE